MDKFFNYLKKGLLATMVVLFAFVVTYVPIPHTNNIHTAEAQKAVIDLANIWQNTITAGATGETALSSAVSAVQDTLTAASSALIAASTAMSEWIESFGDPLAWLVAKTLLSNLVQDLTRWVQSGFEGKPMFVTDIKGFIIDIADEEFGAFIAEQAGNGSFLCSPFKLDILIALNLSFARSIDGAPSCTITDVIANVEGFTSGVKGSFAEGGWNDWIDLTTSPSSNTKYGQFLEAEGEMFARIESSKNEEIAALAASDGFRTIKECKKTPRPDGTTVEDCTVTTPGKLISNSISSNLDSPREVLVTADEIDELIGSLIEQVAIKTFTGARGFLDA